MNAEPLIRRTATDHLRFAYLVDKRLVIGKFVGLVPSYGKLMLPASVMIAAWMP